MRVAELRNATAWAAVILSLLGGGFNHVVAGDAKRLKEQRIPPVEKCDEIYLTTPDGWWMRLYRNHDGQLGYGSSGFDSTRFPVEAFAFEEIYRELKERAFALGSIKDCYAINFHRRGETENSGVYSRDQKAIRKLFDRAKSNAFRTSMAARFEELWEKYPRTVDKPDRESASKEADDIDLLKTAKRFQQPKSYEDASWIFDRRWSLHVMPRLRDRHHPLAAKLDRWVRQDKTRIMNRRLCKESHQFVDKALSAEERKRFVLFGEIANLNRGGKCWLIQRFDERSYAENQNKNTAECLGYIDDKGELLLVWYAPDGRWMPPERNVDAMRLQGIWKVIREEVGGQRKELSHDWFFTFEGNSVFMGDPRLSRNPRLVGSRTFELHEKTKPRTIVMNYREPSWMQEGVEVRSGPIRPINKDPRYRAAYEAAQAKALRESTLDEDAWLTGWMAPRAEFAYSLDRDTLTLWCVSNTTRKGEVFTASDAVEKKSDGRKFRWVFRRTTKQPVVPKHHEEEGGPEPKADPRILKNTMPSI